jgi:antitoxin (DNA-binding transcriptional repressor) of toxin-antitoxin stability system
MRAVNVATLKAKLSEYLRAAKTGESIRILDRRHEIALLSSVSVPEGVRLAQTWVKQGIAEWHGGKPHVKPLKPRKGPAMIADAVLEDRG